MGYSIRGRLVADEKHKNDGSNDKHPNGSIQHVFILHHFGGYSRTDHLRMLKVEGANEKDQSAGEVQQTFGPSTHFHGRIRWQCWRWLTSQEFLVIFNAEKKMCSKKNKKTRESTKKTHAYLEQNMTRLDHPLYRSSKTKAGWKKNKWQQQSDENDTYKLQVIIDRPTSFVSGQASYPWVKVLGLGSFRPGSLFIGHFTFVKKLMEFDEIHLKYILNTS